MMRKDDRQVLGQILLWDNLYDESCLFYYAGDKSRAGGVDPRVQELVALMNQHPDIHTTSSCSGTV
jgi:tRNA(Phe) wybutosine-synthesizing methylase Tyw3